MYPLSLSSLGQSEECPPLLITCTCFQSIRNCVCVSSLIHSARQWWKPGAEFGGPETFFADQDAVFSEKFPF